jgi:D-alanyl-D-alanine dipeptidase
VKKERRILTYEDVMKVPLGENHESLTDVTAYSRNIIAGYEKFDMVPLTGHQIFVRDGLAKRLARAAETLFQKEGMALKVVYGYRHPRIQEQYFQKRYAELALVYHSLSSEELNALVHNFVAVPAAAGHPTGGAVDITLVTKAGDFLEMGTRIADFTDPEKIKAFASGIAFSEKRRRLILRDALLNEGLAPFNGEWWHFSYGDREWACFYGKSRSLYSPIEFQL